MNATKLKLLSILSTFTPDDWKNFGLFIKSPYFVTGRNYSSLFRSFQKKYISVNLNDENKFNKIIYGIFRNKVNEQTIRNRLTEFTALAEKFIKLKYFSEDKLTGEYYLLKHYSDNSHYKEFEYLYDLDIDSLNLLK